MSAEAFVWARKVARPTGKDAKGEQLCLPMAANAVLLLMADYAGRKSDLDPSVETMAEELSCTARTVQRAIASLLADGLIEREFRTIANGKTTSSRYVLRLDRKGRADDVDKSVDNPAEGCLTVTPRGDTQSPSGVTDSHHGGDGQSPSTTFEPRDLTPEVSDEPSGSISEARALEEAGSADFEGLPGDRARRVAADVAEAGYRRLSEAWASRQPGRVHDERARMALAAQLAEGEDVETIVAGGLRFLAESPDAKPPRLPMLDGWIKGKRWRGFEAKASDVDAAEAAALAPKFDGPGELVSRACAIKDRGWFVSYLAQCGWDAGERAIVAPRQFTADAIARDLRGLLAELKITVIVRKAAA